MSFIAVGGFVAIGAGAGAAYLSAGKKPKVPGVPQIDFNALQRDAIAGNMEALGPAGRLATAVNQTNQTELDRVREQSVPGGKAAAQKIIMDQLLGVADITDTQSAIRNASAAGFNLGAGGSQFSKFGVVGHLGRTVGQQKQQGLGNMMAYQSFSEAPRYNPASMFLSVSDRLQVKMAENKMLWDASMAKAAIDAQPSAGAKAAAGGLGALSSFASIGAGSALGAGGKMFGVAAKAGTAMSSGLEYGNVGSLTTPRVGVGDSAYNSAVSSRSYFGNSSGSWNSNPSGYGLGYGY